MAMELCAGGDLMDRICEKKRLEEREVRRYLRQILSAVDHLHKHGIVHRSDSHLLPPHSHRYLLWIFPEGRLQPYLRTVAVESWAQTHTHTHTQEQFVENLQLPEKETDRATC